MPLSLINEFIYHLRERLAPVQRERAEEMSQEEIRELARIRAELLLEREKQRLLLIKHRLFTL